MADRYLIYSLFALISRQQNLAVWVIFDPIEWQEKMRVDQIRYTYNNKLSISFIDNKEEKKSLKQNKHVHYSVISFKKVKDQANNLKDKEIIITYFSEDVVNST